jgi:hypothetical protein
VTAFEYRKRSAHRGAIPALQHKQHGSQNQGKLPRSWCNRGSAARDLIELTEGRQCIVEPQLNELAPSANE